MNGSQEEQMAQHEGPDPGPATMDDLPYNRQERSSPKHDAHMGQAMAAAEREPATHRLVDPRLAGALFDFVGFLTTRAGTMEVGATHSVFDILNYLEEWAAMRGLSLSPALVEEWASAAHQGASPAGYKALAPLLPGEPVFTLRAKDNYSVAMLRLMAPVYGIGDDVIGWFEEWRAANPQHCKDPD